MQRKQKVFGCLLVRLLRSGDFDRQQIALGIHQDVLVDTQGHLLAVKVLAASWSDQHGAKRLLEPLRDGLPRVRVLFGYSHYAGSLLDWVRVPLGWTIQIVRRRKAPARGLLVPIGEEPQWEQLFPPGFQPL